MASPDNLLNLSSTFDDLVEDSEYMDGDYEEYD